MENWFTQFVADLTGRLHGPFSFRFVLQPLMAIVYATLAGLADARAGRPPYFWTMFTRPEERARLLREGWRAMTRVIMLGVVIDTIYQLFVLRSLHPLQLVVVVLGLAFLPYVVLRGPIGRLASWWLARASAVPPRPFEPGTDDETRQRDRASRRRRT